MPRPYAPAATSSSMIPHPPEACSSCRAGNGFTMSRNRKRIKPPSHQRHEPPGHRRSVSICPTTSSITTCPGSVRPKNFSAPLAAQTPSAARLNAAAPIIAISHDRLSGSRPIASISPTPTAEPAVPGATGKYPTPKQVAIQTAGPARRSLTIAFGLLVRGVRLNQIVQAFGLHRG